MSERYHKGSSRVAAGQDLPRAVDLNYEPIPARPQPEHHAAPSTGSSIPHAKGIKPRALIIGAALGILCWVVLILAYIYIVA
jgi:hypothetical protein